MKLKVLAYFPLDGYHECEDESGKFFLVDLYSSRAVGDPNPLANELGGSIIGKVVTCERLVPGLHHAIGVSAVEAAEPATQEAR